jgi:hypothetical protein
LAEGADVATDVAGRTWWNSHPEVSGMTCFSAGAAMAEMQKRRTTADRTKSLNNGGCSLSECAMLFGVTGNSNKDRQTIR